MKGGNMNKLSWITRILVVIGALNWGLIAMGIDLFGPGTFATTIYSLVGLSGLWELIALFKK